jgi:hypothetical protein
MAKEKKQKELKETDLDITLSEKIEPPKIDPKLGDLTPEYINWFANNHPSVEFHQKYVKRRNRIPEQYKKYFLH